MEINFFVEMEIFYFECFLDIGKVNMDRFAPDYYCEETSKGISDARKFVEDMLARNFKLAKPILTPRVRCEFY